MGSNSISPQNVKPIYIIARNLPKDITITELCFRCEKVSGSGSIDGAYESSGVWRIYPMSEPARAMLLANGIEVRRKAVCLESENPFGEKEGTRLSVSNLPFSYSNDAIERNLSSIGVKILKNSIFMEKARYADRTLSDWKTGRRILTIAIPEKVLPKSVKMGNFTAYLFYKEMKEQSIVTCYNCQKDGHKASECTEEVMCHKCKKNGS